MKGKKEFYKSSLENSNLTVITNKIIEFFLIVNQFNT